MDPECVVCGHACPELLGKRSNLHPLDGYSIFVDDINIYDRDVYKCPICGTGFIDPPYSQSDMDGLYNQEGYLKFLENDPIRDLDSLEARALLEIWKQKFVALGVVSWKQKSQTDRDWRPRFLDVGCGKGHNLLIFTELGFEVTGFDLSEKQLAFARKYLPNCDIRESSLEDFDTTERFDCILASHIIEHINSPHAFIARLVQLLTPGGLLIIETPLANDKGDEKHRYRDIYHTLFLNHFNLGLLASMHCLSLENAINAIYKHGGANLIDMVASFTKHDSLNRRQPTDLELIQDLKRCYDSVHRDFLSLSRHFLTDSQGRAGQRSLISRGIRFYLEHGFRPTARTTLNVMLDYLKRTPAWVSSFLGRPFRPGR
jgi:2-polyprenyl-3-methyl-5-hydroxy-6-metoxy-1,4-benzoquinol methylase